MVTSTVIDLEKSYWKTRLGVDGSINTLRWLGYADLGGTGNSVAMRERTALAALLGITEPTLSTRTLDGLRRQYRLTNLGLSGVGKSLADLEILFWAGTPFTAPASTPGDVPTGLSLWLKADSIAQADGSNVTSWADSSAAGNTATEATNPPFFYLNQQNGKPAVYFNGTTNKLSSAASSAYSAQTIMAVVGLVLPSAATNAISGAPANGGMQFRVNNATIQLVKQGIGVIGSSSAGAVDGAFHLITATYDSVSGAYNIYVDQVSKGSGTNALALTANTLTIGVAGTQFLNGYIGEYALWNRILTAGELANVSNGLKAKWATP